jgi:23S rRNA pseudouridine1911/1915/1917 synthase
MTVSFSRRKVEGESSDMQKQQPEVRELVAAAADAGQRLDRFIADRLAADSLSRSRVKALIEAGCLTRNGAKIRDPSERVKPGQDFTLHLPPPEPAEPAAQAMPLAVLFEDPHLIVIDKPAGLVVHPAPGNPDRTLVNALIAHCGPSLSGIGGVRRPGIVHRLDKDTSGILVAAKTDAAHQGLAALFAARDIERAYTAFVWGLPSPTQGTIEAAIGRDGRERTRMAVVADAAGRAAVTGYKVLRGFGLLASELDCRLQTGRTHQIRVHLAHVGHPLIGDPVYGRRVPAEGRQIAFRRQALHARLLGFDHPVTGERLHFESELPADLLDLRANLTRSVGY